MKGCASQLWRRIQRVSLKTRPRSLQTDVSTLVPSTTTTTAHGIEKKREILFH